MITIPILQTRTIIVASESLKTENASITTNDPEAFSTSYNTGTFVLILTNAKYIVIAS